jgi:hypothetical protein
LERKRPSKQDDFSEDDNDFARPVLPSQREQHLERSSPAGIGGHRHQHVVFHHLLARPLQHVWIKRANFFRAFMTISPAIGQQFSNRTQDQSAQRGQGSTAAWPTSEQGSSGLFRPPRRILPPACRGGENANHAVCYNPISTFPAPHARYWSRSSA